jgi:hypothetical protein
MAKIQIGGGEYKVVESLGWVHDIGAYAKVVGTEDGEKVAVKYRGGPWRFWTAKDKLRPGGPMTGQSHEE